MPVYLFRQRNADRALTTDITGRNLPLRRPTSYWMFVKTLQIDKCPLLPGIADFEEACAADWSKSATISFKRTLNRDRISPASSAISRFRMATCLRNSRATLMQPWCPLLL
jgi:hypothetical protein